MEPAHLSTDVVEIFAIKTVSAPPALTVRAVLDANVLISALLAPDGTPARVLRAWLDGAFELVASDGLLAVLDRALAYPKLRKRIAAEEAHELIELLRREAQMTADPKEPPSTRSPDPGDDDLPVYSPAEFLALLAEIS